MKSLFKEENKKLFSYQNATVSDGISNNSSIIYNHLPLSSSLNKSSQSSNQLIKEV
jgi:hypothetical protein